MMLHKLVNEEMELEMAFDSDPIVHFILVRIWTVKPSELIPNVFQRMASSRFFQVLFYWMGMYESSNYF